MNQRALKVSQRVPKVGQQEAKKNQKESNSSLNSTQNQDKGEGSEKVAKKWGAVGVPSSIFWCHFGTIFYKKYIPKPMNESVPKIMDMYKTRPKRTSPGAKLLPKGGKRGPTGTPNWSKNQCSKKRKKRWRKRRPGDLSDATNLAYFPSTMHSNFDAKIDVGKIHDCIRKCYRECCGNIKI